MTQQVPDNNLQLHPSALQHIKRALAKLPEPKPIGMRIHVRKAGCSGYEYVLTYAQAQDKKNLDEVFSFEDIDILVDKAIYAKFLAGGTRINLKKEGLNEGLSFENPNVADACGCGESFTLKDELDDE